MPTVNVEKNRNAFFKKVYHFIKINREQCIRYFNNGRRFKQYSYMCR